MTRSTSRDVVKIHPSTSAMIGEFNIDDGNIKKWSTPCTVTLLDIPALLN